MYTYLYTRIHLSYVYIHNTGSIACATMPPGSMNVFDCLDCLASLCIGCICGIDPSDFSLSSSAIFVDIRFVRDTSSCDIYIYIYVFWKVITFS